MLRFIGLDIGTTTISAVAIDGENGKILKAITVDNDSAINSENKARRMQDPLKIKEKVFMLRDALVKEFAPITAIGVTGQMHGILYLDKYGVPVSPLYTWQDASGSLPYEGGTYASVLSEKSGYALASGYGLVTDFVNRDQGDVPENAVTLCTVHDYISMSLAGKKAPLVHTSDAASLGCFSLKDGCFDKAATDALKIDYGFLPKTTADTAICGNDCNGIPVAVAIGDNQASVLGSIKGDDCLLINIGTGSQVSLITKSPQPFSDGEVRPLTNDSYMLVGAPLCGGRSFALLHSFFKECAKLFGGDADNIYPVMDALALEDPDNHSLKVDTRFCGTRKDPSVTGGISGITDTNFTPAELTRGFLYGMADELYTLYSSMLAVTDAPAKSIAGSGNAIRKSPVLRAYLEEMFGLPLNIPAHREEAAFGAALFASVASGSYKTLAEAEEKLVHYTER